jgi:TolB protein
MLAILALSSSLLLSGCNLAMLRVSGGQVEITRMPDLAEGIASTKPQQARLQTTEAPQPTTAASVTAPVSAPPTAHFVISVTDLTVAFTSAATGEDLYYSWDFGDGNTSLEKDPTHTYLAGGSYAVVHSVSNEGGDATYEELVSVSEAYQPAAASDAKIAFTSDRDGNNEIYVMDADGANAVNLTNHPSSDRHPTWSPDGSAIVFASRRDDNVFDIYRLDVETGAVTRLTNQGANTGPAWSPDGARIAFVSDRFGDKDIMVMNADGSHQIQLTVDVHIDDQPTWSPDGGAIAFVSDASGSRTIYVIDSFDGSEVLTLTDKDSEDFQPSWLGNSAYSLLLFTSTRSGNQDIYVIDPATGEQLRQLTSDISAERQPSWSDDGGVILFVSDRDNDGERNIYTMNTDGENVQRLSPLGSNDREPKWR